jgi:Ca-activated chloride channel family protein
MPLEHTDIRARVAGHVASVDVEQRYGNPYDRSIEAVYVFPLPEDAAVSDFVMTIGKRRIRGIVRERAQAEQIYRDASEAGLTASMMTEERPNVFTQKVANIAPGHRIDVVVTYFQALPYRDGEYTLVIPTVVGPRYNPAGTTDGIGAVAHGRAGVSGQRTEIGYLAPGRDSGHRVSLSVDLDAGVSIERVQSEHHRLDTQTLSPSHRRLTLAAGATIPDRDFVLRYKVAGEQLKSAFLADRGGHFTFLLQPPASLASARRAPVEMVFVLDCSGSMAGEPLARAKRAIRRALLRLDPQDTFQIIQFSETAFSLGPRPIPATPDNLRRGLRYLAGLQGEGGTEMITGIKAALDFPHAPHRLRLVSFMTDGFIGNEAEILAAIHAMLGASRIFSFGVGSSVNRYLLEWMAVVGRGAVAYVGLDDASAEQAVDAFYERISHPALTEVSLDFGDGKVAEVYPSRIPDLFVGRPVTVAGRLRGAPPSSVRVRGRIAGKPVELTVAVPRGAVGAHPALAKIWAKMKIGDAGLRAIRGGDPHEYGVAVRNISIAHGLLSPFTAFLAVDTAGPRQRGGPAATVAVPVRTPAGVRHDTTVVQ